VRPPAYFPISTGQTQNNTFAPLITTSWNKLRSPEHALKLGSRMESTLHRAMHGVLQLYYAKIMTWKTRGASCRHIAGTSTTLSERVTQGSQKELSKSEHAPRSVPFPLHQRSEKSTVINWRGLVGDDRALSHRGVTRGRPQDPPMPRIGSIISQLASIAQVGLPGTDAWPKMGERCHSASAAVPPTIAAT